MAERRSGGIVKARPKCNYEPISRERLQDPTLSWKATGLYAYLCSLPPGWLCSRDRLARDKTDGIYSTRSALAELRKKGFLHTLRRRKPNGRFETITLFYPEPTSTPTWEDLVEPAFDYRPTENRPTVNRPTENRPI